MSLISSGIIETYIQRVTELSQSNPKRIPTPTELEKIVSELGIAPEEIAKAEQESQAHFIRAQGYLRLKYWDDAILELQEAIAFNPSSAEMMLAAANAYLGRWKKSHTREDATQFHLRIRQCLAIQPDSEEALNLLQKFQGTRQKRQQQWLYLGVFSGALVMGAIGYLLMDNRLPYVLQKRTDLEIINQKIDREIQIIRNEQASLRKELRTFHNDQMASSQREIAQLNNRINNLEKSLQDLQKRLSWTTLPLLPPSSEQN
jgi:tetratricopeptide (TPR) repeat protein